MLDGGLDGLRVGHERGGRVDRVLLDRVSSVLVIAGFIIGVGSVVLMSQVYGRIPSVRDTPGAWVYVIVGTAGGVMAYAGVILDQYLKTGSLRKAIISWAIGFAVVLAVAVGGYLLRR